MSLINPSGFPWDPAWAPNLCSINHYRGCSFDCQYPCWAKELATRFKRLPSTGNWRDVEVAPAFRATKEDRDYHKEKVAKFGKSWPLNEPKVIGGLEHLIQREIYDVPSGTILLSATCDPYPPLEKELGLTAEILNGIDMGERGLRSGRGITPTLKGWPGHKFLILTKSPLVLRDAENFFIHWTREGWEVWVGFTLTAPSYRDTLDWEPYAPSNADRIKALRELHGKGIKTFVSIEPWLILTRYDIWGIWPPGGKAPEVDRYYDITRPDLIIEETKAFVDYYILGTWNQGHKPRKELIPFYQQELPSVIKALEKYAPGRYWLKPELREVLVDGNKS